MAGTKKGLPSGWTETAIGDVTVAKVPQMIPQDEEHYTYIDISSVDNISKKVTQPKHISGAEAPSRARQRVIRDDVLVSMTRPNLNSVAIVAEDIENLVASTGFDVLRAAGIEPLWIFHHVCSQEFVRQMTGLVQGALYPAIKSPDIRDYKIPLPPLNEQKRIVLRIGEIRTHSRRAREALETVPDLLERLRQSALAAAFRGDLTKKWREEHSDVEPASELLKRIRTERRKRWEESELEKLKRKGFTDETLDSEFAKRRRQYKEPVRAEDAGLPDLPDGWCWSMLPELGYMNRGKSRHRPRNAPHLYGGKYPFVQTGDIAKAKGRITNHTQSYSEAGLAQSKIWPEGTICITIAANIANSAILTYPACFPDSVVGIIPDVCPSEYIEYFIRTVRNDLERFAPATAQKNINIGILNNVAIPLAPQEETDVLLRLLQKALSNIEANKSAMEEGFKKLLFLDQTILSKAFRGELVPQDLNDEPASVLLERIRREKERLVAEEKPIPKRRGGRMKQVKQRHILGVLQKAEHPMTPEDLFAACGFDEDSVDLFYEQLREAVAANLVKEAREGDAICLEAII